MLILQPTVWSATAQSATGDVVWALSRDGQGVAAHGRDPVSLLPADNEVVLVVPPLAASWQQVTLPRLPASRLRQALDGLLEDRLLADTATLHCALAPGWQGSQPGWVCLCDRATLQHWLATLQAAGRPVSRIVPALTPDAPASSALPSGHDAADGWHAVTVSGQPWLVHAGPDGVWPLPLTADATSGTVSPAPDWQAAAAALPGPLFSEPGLAEQAETLLKRPAVVQPAAQQLLRSAQTEWNLAQFDLRLSAGARRGQSVAQAWRQWLHAPAWRPMRWGLAAVVVANVVGALALAHQARTGLATRQQVMQQLLTQTFPGVTVVLDAPRQMQQGVERLQRESGAPSAGDLDTFLSIFSALPLNGTQVTAIDFDNNGVQLRLNQANDATLTAVREQLERKGWRTRYAEQVLTANLASPVHARFGERPPGSGGPSGMPPEGMQRPPMPNGTTSGLPTGARP